MSASQQLGEETLSSHRDSSRSRRLVCLNRLRRIDGATRRVGVSPWTARITHRPESVMTRREVATRHAFFLGAHIPRTHCGTDAHSDAEPWLRSEYQRSSSTICAKPPARRIGARHSSTANPAYLRSSDTSVHPGSRTDSALSGDGVEILRRLHSIEPHCHERSTFRPRIPPLASSRAHLRISLSDLLTRRVDR